MAVEYDISSDVAVIKETGSVSQCARVTQMYSGQITYDDEAGSKFATATINGKSQRVMLCIAVSGTVTYDDVPSLYSTVDGHRCLNIVTPTETGTPDDVPSLYETVVIDGQNVRAVRCIMINKTPVYDGVSSTCTFTGDDGKTHTAQLVNKVTGGSVQVIIKGTSPLNLPDAIANSLSYVKAFGGTEQNGTPTPDTPVDIVSNNGVLKARHQSGLPWGYTLLDYIESTGTQYIDLGYKGNGTTKAEVRFKYHTATSASGSGRVFGSRNTAAVNAFAIGSASGTASTNSTIAFFFGNQSYLVTDKSLVLDEWLDVVFDKTTHNINGTDYGDPYNDETFETPQNLKLFGFDNNGTMGYGQVDIARCKLWDNGVLIRDLVPCKNASNVVGMYDLVSGQFFTNQGTGTFTAGNPVSDPVEIYTDGTVETINAHGKNLLNLSSFVRGKYINASGVEQNGGYGYSSIIKVVPGKKYTYNATYSSGTQTRIHGYQDGVWVLQIETGAAAFWPHTITIPANINGIRISCYPAPTNPQFELGETATAYEPYFDGGTATAEMLLKVGDYQDEQQILSGAITRKVGVKVFDGTENWVANTVSSGRLVFYVTKVSIGSDSTVLPNGSSNIKCSHFETSTAAAQSLYGTVWAGGTAINFTAGDFCADLTAWKQWLADQYAAGTPVILVYPLATPTTESVTGQTLQVTGGDNVLEITQASLTGLELEAQYSAAVSLTIQEVEDANLDNNVEVTIS